jgi:leader peptidase (prepilin peptidase)/N-methyltransferase
MNFFLQLYIFIFGSMIGSFLNALIYRLPREIDFVWARSHCPKCKAKVNWYDNFPLLSFLLLKGKCRSCCVKISYKYPFVELISGVAALYFYNNESSLFTFAIYFLMTCAFIVHTFIDLEFKILPDVVNIFLLILYVVWTIYFGVYEKAIFGFLLGFAVPYIIALLYEKLAKREGLGMGDVKLFAVLGIFFGPKEIMEILFLSSLLGSVVGIFLIILKRMTKEEGIPFGPYIIASALIRLLITNS